MCEKTERISMRRNISVVFVLASAWLLFVPMVRAQATASKDPQTVSEQDIQLLRQDVRSRKKQLIAANLTLTDAEATQFWPVYDQYSAEMTKIGDQRYALIKEYAQNFGSLTDDQALSLINRSLALDEAVEQLRIKYVPIINKVLTGKKTTTFFQMDRRITALIDLQLASQIPLVQEQR
jgi:recombinational DNA repair ATPase RecF